MPILGGGLVSQANRSGIVVRFSQQPIVAFYPNPTCNRVVIPPSVEPAPANTFAIVNNANTQALHIGRGAYLVEKISGGAASNADAVSTTGIVGPFVLHAHLIDDDINLHLGVSADAAISSTDASIERAFQFFRPNAAVYYYENGVLDVVGSFGYAFGNATDVWMVRDAADAITVWSNTTNNLATATLQKTMTPLAGTVYFDSAIYDVGDKIEVDVYRPEALVGSVSVAFSTSGALAGTGALSGTSTPAFTTAGILKGAGALAGATTLTFATAGIIRGNGALTGASSLTFSPSGTISGQGALAGASALTFAPAGVLGASGALSGSCSASFATAGTIQAQGVLSGATNLVFTVQGNLEGAVTPGAIQGSANWSFIVSGTLTNLIWFVRETKPDIVAASLSAEPVAVASVIAAEPSLGAVVIETKPPVAAMVHQ